AVYRRGLCGNLLDRDLGGIWLPLLGGWCARSRPRVLRVEIGRIGLPVTRRGRRGYRMDGSASTPARGVPLRRCFRPGAFAAGRLVERTLFLVGLARLLSLLLAGQDPIADTCSGGAGGGSLAGVVSPTVSRSRREAGPGERTRARLRAARGVLVLGHSVDAESRASAYSAHVSGHVRAAGGRFPGVRRPADALADGGSA